jgi:hypothetical protein
MSFDDRPAHNSVILLPFEGTAKLFPDVSLLLFSYVM